MAEETLGKLAAATASTVRQRGWKEFVDRTRGASDLSDGVAALPHKAARLLEHLRRRGAPVLTKSAPWGPGKCDEAMHRGPHKSSHDEREFVFEKNWTFAARALGLSCPIPR